MFRKNNKPAIKSGVSAFNEKLFFSKELTGIGYVGRRGLKRGSRKTLASFSRSVSYTSTKSFGAFFLSFGLLTLFLHLIRYYFESQPTVPLSSIIIGAVIAVLSLPLLRSEKPLCVLLQDIPVTDFIFFEFFSIKRMHKISNSKTIPPVIAFFLGFLPAAIGFVFSPVDVFIAIVCLIFVVVAFVSPEFSLIFTLLILPFIYFLPHSTLTLALLSLLTFISFARKVILGKRVYHFEIYDVIILAISALFVISGILNDTVSAKDAFVIVALIFGYFNVSNLIANRRLADCAVHAVVFSSIPVSILAIIEYIVENVSTTIPIPSNSTPGVSCAFDTPDALAAFLIVCVTFALGFTMQNQTNFVHLILYFAASLLNVFVLVLVSVPWVYVTAIISIPAILIITSRRLPIDALLAIVALAHLVLLIPPETLDSAFEVFGLDSLVSDKVQAYGESFNRIFEQILLGSGINAGGEYNLFIGIGLKTGLLGLVVFVLMLAVRNRHLSYYRLFVRNCGLEMASNASAISIFSLLVFGVLNPVISDASMFYLFFAVFGIGTASLRAAKIENDDRLGYYKDSRSVESSALDIELVNKE